MPKDTLPMISIIVPIYNDAYTLPYLVKAILKSVEEIGPVELFLVDGGSTDGTLEIARELRQPFSVVVLSSEPSYASALRTGLEASTGAALVFLDPSLDYDPNQIPQLVRPILANQADVVIGSRFLKASRVHRGAVSLVQRVSQAALKALSRLLLGAVPTDPESHFLAVRRQSVGASDILFGHLPFGLIVFKAASGQLRFKEIEVYYRIRASSSSKLDTRASLRALWQGFRVILRLRATR